MIPKIQHRYNKWIYLQSEGGLTKDGLIAPDPATLPLLPPLVGVTDFEMGVVGFSSIFFVDGVLAFDDVPLLGLHIKIIQILKIYTY